jgi:hypothetical protein
MLCSFILLLLFVTGRSLHECGRLSENEAAKYFILMAQKVGWSALLKFACGSNNDLASQSFGYGCALVLRQREIDSGFDERRELWRLWCYLAVATVEQSTPFGRRMFRLSDAVNRYQ